MLHTPETVAALLRSQLESDTPDQVAAALRPHDGKMVTTRLLKYLPGGADEWRLRREYGMTHIERSWQYQQAHPEAARLSILLAHTEASFPLDVDAMIEKNSAYFSARVERNAARNAMINSPADLQRMAAAMNAVDQTLAALRAAVATFTELTEYGAPFNHDSYTLERAAGLRTERDTRVLCECRR